MFEDVQVEILVDSEKWSLNLGKRTELALDLGVTGIEVIDKDRGKSSRHRGSLPARESGNRCSHLPCACF